MNKKEALEILEIANDLSDYEIVEQAKQQLKKLYERNFITLSCSVKKDNPEELSKKIEAYKFLRTCS